MDATRLFMMVACAASFGAYSTMLGGAVFTLRRHRAGPKRGASRAPRVTIFKPLAGADDDLPANLASFATIDYPEFEILFGVATIDDPGARVARAFIAANPHVQAELVVTRRDAAYNPKVAQLIGLEKRATGSVFVISDSNVRVGPDYLFGLVAELEDPTVGIVTSVFSGTGERTLGAALENLQICAAAAPGVIAIDRLLERSPTIGKSMALRRRDLAMMGGFKRVSDVLAEDQVLGHIVLESGLRTRLCLDPVENRNTDCTAQRTLERHTRWAQLRRSLFPKSFIWEPLLTPTLIAALGVAVHPARTELLLFLIVAIAQTLMSLQMVRYVRGEPMPLRYAPLEIVRSFAVFYCWCAAFTTRVVGWRGNQFMLYPGTKIVPIAAAPESLPDRVVRFARSLRVSR